VEHIRLLPEAVAHALNVLGDSRLTSVTYADDCCVVVQVSTLAEPTRAIATAARMAWAFMRLTRGEVCVGQVRLESEKKTRPRRQQRHTAHRARRSGKPQRNVKARHSQRLHDS
jgi:hypothetical protein